jgi:hypothetical protein
MAYDPLFELSNPQEIPPSLLRKLGEELLTVQGPYFDKMPAGARCSAILQMIRTLVEIDKWHLHYHPEYPSLYSSGVVYRTQQTVRGNLTGMDHWWNLPTVYKMGEGSCEDLAAIRVAELQMKGPTAYDRAARPKVHSKLVGGNSTYHVIVAFPDNREEDPSLLLGMPTPF